ncbi:amino acid ABC transporter permease [Pelagibacterium sp. 26DY04]|uniref:amino acid ABC transporter permease n=1 Tax=Pelagibacterium sp. H642 TaxID=1881069 RepID=UPI002816478F|nr:MULTISPECIES: amino acid ABC transporter permease [unclassified Pelagibacterium]WMT85282.1 amino acid ABC transporter permease [Pelagibacterium sp. 26DY04]WMT90411.1 amino acid ABC transporter permease [Pelagibacterium sp. H642]
MTDLTTWDILRNLALSTRWTILLSLISFVGGGVLALLLLPLRTSSIKALNVISRAYVDLFQGTPLLIQLFVLFFGLPLIGIDTSAWLAAILGLSLWTAAFLTEIWKGCVQSVHKGQWEASASLGMSYLEQMRYIILPQAFVIAIPPTVGFMVQIIKATAITSIIGFIEVSRAGGMMANVTFQPFLVYGIVATIYFILCWPLSQGSRNLERKLNVAHRNQ